jgi:hypothetical protein
MFLSIHHFSAKITILPPIFTVNFRELRGVISRTVWIKLVSVQFLSLSWFYFMISLVKIEVFGQVLKPYARERILAGYPYGACENSLFPQAGLR